MVRFGEAALPTASTVLQEGDQLVVAVTDEVTGRLHDVVEKAPEGRQH
jgi:trk system potassium uptake protein TrkA